MARSDANTRIMDRVIGHHLEVLRLGEGLVKEVLDRLRIVEQDTYDAISDRGKEDGTIPLYRVNRLLRQLSSLNTAAYRDIGRYMSLVLRTLAKYEVETTTAIIEQAAPYQYKMRRPYRSVLDAIVDEQPLVGGLLEEWIAGIADGRWQRLRAAIRIGVVNQETIPQIIRRLRGTPALAYRNGIARTSINSAQALVRTAVTHMANTAKVTLSTYNSEIVAAMMWSAVLDDVCCEECAALDGEYFDPDEVENPPSLHINCRCVLIPILGDFDEYELPRPKKLLYGDWLKQQSVAAQNQILGAERAAMFRRGMPLKKFTDNSGIKYNLAELRQVEAKLMPKKTKAISRKSSKVLRNFGWKPDLPDQRDHLFAIQNKESVALPVKVSLRKNMPPVFDQGNLGSCVANACVAAHMFVHGGEQMMSRLDLYWSARYLEGMVDEDSGVMIRDGVKAMAKFGVCTEKTWPYKIRKFRDDPPPVADKEALQYKITSYQRLKSHDDYLKCLAKGLPFIFGYSVFDNMFASMCDKHAILTKPPMDAQMIGGHSCLCIGYDQNFHDNPIFKKSGLSTDQVPKFVYEIRNSWGANWADAGHFWVDAAYLEDRDLSDDFWAVTT